MVELETLETRYEELLAGLHQEIVHEGQHEQSVEDLGGAFESWLVRFSDAVRFEDVDAIQTLSAELDSLKSKHLTLMASANSYEQSSKYIRCMDDSQTLDELGTRIGEQQQRIAADIEEITQPASPPLIVEELDIGEPFADDYDVDAAAEVFAAIFRDQRPRDVLRQHGFDDFETGSSDMSSSDFGGLKELQPGPSHSRHLDDDFAISPIPEDPGPSGLAEVQVAQQHRSRWRRVLRTALPLQAMLVLLLGAACLVPHCDDDYCCHLLNNFAKTLDPQLDFTNGPPPF